MFCGQVAYLPDTVVCEACDDALFATVAGDTYPTWQDREDEYALAMEWEARYSSL
jgi:hypothetical protein